MDRIILKSGRRIYTEGLEWVLGWLAYPVLDIPPDHTKIRKDDLYLGVFRGFWAGRRTRFLTHQLDSGPTSNLSICTIVIMVRDFLQTIVFLAVVRFPNVIVACSRHSDEMTMQVEFVVDEMNFHFEN